EELMGIDMRQLIALSYLEERESTRQQALADVLCMDADNVVLLLNELEGMGYVERVRDPEDRRRHRVEITSAGRQVLKRAERAQKPIEHDILRLLDANERAALWQLLIRAVQGANPEGQEG
ncbi:MAG TPA: MarR family transcriptional regulator, partial [Acidimicrobiales bacterium]|nr:MarR family transcriptional regulator [Acidimicrobiales bacterium]